MVTQTTKVVNPSGLHARPASVFVKCAMGFASALTVRNVSTDSEAKDAKSILSVMGLGMKKGHEIEICADGPDEQEAASALVQLVASGCGE